MRWDYVTTEVKVDGASPGAVSALNEGLRQRGSEGCELVEALPRPDGWMVLIFKKQHAGN
jgi:hypothetical protein